MKTKLESIQTLERWKALAQAMVDAADFGQVLQIKSLSQTEARNLTLYCAKLCKAHAPDRGSNSATIWDAHDYITGHSTWTHRPLIPSHEEAYWKLNPAVMAVQEAVDNLIAGPLPALTVADKALAEIEAAYPLWINATRIAEMIGSTPKTVRAKLSERYPSGTCRPYESETGGSNLGYRWLK
jgi:hypothetical protein